MKNRILTLLSVLVLTVAATAAKSKSVVIDGVRYTANGRETASVRIDDRNNRMRSIIIVADRVNIGGKIYTVTDVEPRGFKSCPYVTNIVLPSSIKEIGAYAFEGCSTLSQVTLPEEANVQTIEFAGKAKHGPFYKCTALTNIENIDDVHRTTLEMCFYNCDKTPVAGNVARHLTDFANAKISGKQKEHKPKATRVKVDHVSALSTIDSDIPAGSGANTNTLVLVIGNETYENEITPVDYAVNDATVFASYCEKTLGISKEHIRIIKDATYMQMKNGVNWLKNVAEIERAGSFNVIFYYAGHGVPNEKSGEAFLMPVDGSDSYQDSWIPLNDLYASLNSIGAKSTVVMLDACFSGAGRDNSAIKKGGRAIRARISKQAPMGNMLVLAAASDSQIANPYADMHHGVFTYHLLEKLQETRGKVTYGELFDHISQKVPRTVMKEFERIQTPTVFPSGSMANTWESTQFAK